MDSIEKLYSSIKNEKIRKALKDFANSVAEYQQREVYQLDNVRWSLEKLIDEIQNRKVYVVSTGDDDDYGIDGISSTPEIAKDFMNQFPDQHKTYSFNDLEEIVIDNFYKIPEGKFPYFARIEKDTLKILELEKEPLITYDTKLVERVVNEDRYGNFMVYVWASNDDEAYENSIIKLKEYLKSQT